ncbi:hypothetical protein B0H19DRAFT_1078944 [Mycena capillaripes]|nr:hypothetical protein B0H19DRAFT_1078944 [Mycena capillaripes]
MACKNERNGYLVVEGRPAGSIPCNFKARMSAVVGCSFCIGRSGADFRTIMSLNIHRPSMHQQKRCVEASCRLFAVDSAQDQDAVQETDLEPGKDWSVVEGRSSNIWQLTA